MPKQRIITFSRASQILLIQDLYDQIRRDGFDPDHVVAVAGGGLTIGRRLKSLLKKPLAIMMAEHWPGGREAEAVTFARHVVYKTPTIGGRILLVDDLTDTGKTLMEGAKYLRRKFPAITEIRTATIWYKEVSALRPDYLGAVVAVDPLLDPDGLVPWIEQPDEADEPFPVDGYRLVDT